MSAPSFVPIAMKNRDVTLTIDGTDYNIKDELQDVEFGDSPAPTNVGTTLGGAGYAAAGFATPAQIDMTLLVNPGLAYAEALFAAQANGDLILISAKTAQVLLFKAPAGVGGAGFTIASGSADFTVDASGEAPSQYVLARGAGIALDDTPDRLVGVVESTVVSSGRVASGKLAANNPGAAVASTDKAKMRIVRPSYQIDAFPCEIVLWNENKKDGEGATGLQTGLLQLQPVVQIPKSVARIVPFA